MAKKPTNTELLDLARAERDEARDEIDRLRAELEVQKASRRLSDQTTNQEFDALRRLQQEESAEYQADIEKRAVTFTEWYGRALDAEAKLAAANALLERWMRGPDGTRQNLRLYDETRAHLAGQEKP